MKSRSPYQFAPSFIKRRLFWETLYIKRLQRFKKLAPDLGGGRRGDGGRAERVPAPSVGQNTNLKTIPRGRYGGLRSRGVSGDHGLGGNSREEILDFPLS